MRRALVARLATGTLILRKQVLQAILGRLEVRRLQSEPSQIILLPLHRLVREVVVYALLHVEPLRSLIDTVVHGSRLLIGGP